MKQVNCMDIMKLFTEKNVGGLDRAVRLVIGVGLLYVFFQNYVTGWMNYVVLLISLVGLYTGIMSHCTIYTLFGFKTNK